MLAEACDTDDIEIVRALVEKGANIKPQRPINPINVAKKKVIWSW